MLAVWKWVIFYAFCSLPDKLIQPNYSRIHSALGVAGVSYYVFDSYVPIYLSFSLDTL